MAGDYLTAGSSAFHGRFQGTLHLRAPRTVDNRGIQIDPISSTITGASAIIAEGFKLYNLTDDTVGDITLTVDAGSRTLEVGKLNTLLRDQIDADNEAFFGTTVDSFANESTLLSSLLARKSDLAPLFVLAPGVEIINRSGDLTLGLANNATGGSTNIEAQTAADWDFSSFRYGAKSAPGILTLRAAGDLVFNNPQRWLQPGDNHGGYRPPALWLATPQTLNTTLPVNLTTLPVNLQSWSYRLAAGSDFTSASHRRVAPMASLAGKGSVLVGEFYSAVPNTSTSGDAAAVGKDGQTADSIRISTTTANRGTRHEVVRTGTGEIDIAAAKDVQLRNPFATVYTSGVALPDPTRIFEAGDFCPAGCRREPAAIRTRETSVPFNKPTIRHTPWRGMISVAAGNDIGRFTRLNGDVVADASRQLPTNWLYRRGQVDPATGLFAEGGVGSPGDLGLFTDPSASTTWWVDFSNYFGGFGALGGGSITLAAGRDLVNADAAAPTTECMAALPTRNASPHRWKNSNNSAVATFFLSAGRNIDGGSFHVDRGTALLNAGAEITTNSAQSPRAIRWAPPARARISSTRSFGSRSPSTVQTRRSR